MNKYKKVKLITWEKFEKFFKLDADEWKKHQEFDDISIIYKNFTWYINADMINLFGKSINVREFTEMEKEDYMKSDYTHADKQYGWHWHELWFKEDFIKEDEFKI